MKWLTKLFISAILFLICLILIKSNKNFKNDFYVKVYEDNFNFAYVNNIYNKYLGNILPNVIPNQSVFKEELDYVYKTSYLDGVSLEVNSNYLVPVLTNGLVLFIGEKEGYGNTIIISGEDGIDIWYSNLNNISVKLYDYVKEGSLIGEACDKLYLVFKKDGEVLNYENYIN